MYSGTKGKAAASAYKESEAAQAATRAAVTTGVAAAAGQTTAISGLLVSAGVVSSVPVAGWIVAGGLLAAAGIIVIVKAYKNSGRKEAKAQAERMGEGGKAFAREFARNSNKSRAKINKDIVKLKQKIAEKESKDRRVGQKRREKRLTTLADQLNANLILLALRDAKSGAPAIRGEPDTIPIAAPVAETPAEAAAEATGISWLTESEDFSGISVPNWALVAGGVAGVSALAVIAYKMGKK